MAAGPLRGNRPASGARFASGCRTLGRWLVPAPGPEIRCPVVSGDDLLFAQTRQGVPCRSGPVSLAAPKVGRAVPCAPNGPGLRRVPPCMTEDGRQGMGMDRVQEPDEGAPMTPARRNGTARETCRGPRHPMPLVLQVAGSSVISCRSEWLTMPLARGGGVRMENHIGAGVAPFFALKRARKMRPIMVRLETCRPLRARLDLSPVVPHPRGRGLPWACQPRLVVRGPPLVASTSGSPFPAKAPAGTNPPKPRSAA